MSFYGVKSKNSLMSWM